ncbi:MAG: (E)-4-hydroxy-3-methylbut-2-enyl-diphosphate synthase [Chlorobiaceae bacterium]|jgi:(E)-4-hydroxy-3-methylbut-2-enyl-diphosphate synthase|nr:(E)-4-hydroxy-3-methylbut-2-enyl-diphosphate synthase [Chlorobiaceae bacterium]
MYHYRRRFTREVAFGPIALGGYQPIRVESMTNTHTMDTVASVEQCRQLYEAGCEIIRLTVPTERDAENLREIRDQLRRDGIRTPLVADIHFSSRAALRAVEYVENIRINPGNYANRQKFSSEEYTDDEYRMELDTVRNEFLPLVKRAKELGVSMRIGTNHGSLSDRIVSRYGNSPEGMVEAALEFARICEEYGYYDLLFSMKSSNVRVMIQAYRLLAERADAELNHAYPLHLGVTEAGDGDEGRVKSAMGIGALLEDGLGDTIRVSLTEDPVNEVPVGFAIVKKYNDYHLVKGDRAHLPVKHVVESRQSLLPEPVPPFDPFSYSRRYSGTIALGDIIIGNDDVPRIETGVHARLSDIGEASREVLQRLVPEKSPDAIRSELVSFSVDSRDDLAHLDALLVRLGDVSRYMAASTEDHALFTELAGKVVKARLDIREAEMLDSGFLSKLDPATPAALEFCFIHEQTGERVAAEVLCHIAEKLKARGFERLFFSICSASTVFVYRHLVREFNERGIDYPVVVRYSSCQDGRIETLVEASIQAGSLFCDGIGDILALETALPVDEEVDLCANILQGSRTRMSKTEFISCPGCGRTYFDLEHAATAIKKRLSHLKGLKIGIMGCVVNGPGEMADADFGYVGSGKGRISLYVGKDCVEQNIPEDVAVDRLIGLIRERGKWVDPE